MVESVDYFFYVVLLAVISGIVSFVLSIQWNLFYFQFGIPVFRKRYLVETTINFSSGVEKLERRLQGEYWYRPLEFKVIDADKCLFRQKPIDFRIKIRNIAIIHGGVLQYHSEKSSLTVTGYLSWPLLFMLVIGYLLVIQLQMPLVISLIILGIIMGVIYWFEIRRYDEMGRLAASLSKNRRYTSKRNI